MTAIRNIILIAAVAAVLGGCSTIDRMTGSVDNTVLPGQREDAIPGRAKFPESDPASTASTGAPQQAPSGADEPLCPADDPSCAPPAGDDTFSDPQ